MLEASLIRKRETQFLFSNEVSIQWGGGHVIQMRQVRLSRGGHEEEERGKLSMSLICNLTATRL